MQVAPKPASLLVTDGSDLALQAVPLEGLSPKGGLRLVLRGERVQEKPLKAIEENEQHGEERRDTRRLEPDDSRRHGRRLGANDQCDGDAGQNAEEGS